MFSAVHLEQGTADTIHDLIEVRIRHAMMVGDVQVGATSEVAQRTGQLNLCADCLTAELGCFWGMFLEDGSQLHHYRHE